MRRARGRPPRRLAGRSWWSWRSGGVAVETEEVVEALLGGVGLGQHAPGAWAAAQAISGAVVVVMAQWGRSGRDRRGGRGVVGWRRSRSACAGRVGGRPGD